RRQVATSHRAGGIGVRWSGHGATSPTSTAVTARGGRLSGESYRTGLITDQPRGRLSLAVGSDLGSAQTLESAQTSGSAQASTARTSAAATKRSTSARTADDISHP